MQWRCVIKTGILLVNYRRKVWRYKRTNNDLQSPTQNTKDRATRTPLKTGGERMWSCAPEEFEDTKGVIRIRISKTNRQHNGQKKKYNRTNNDLQNIHKPLCITNIFQRINESRSSKLNLSSLINNIHRDTKMRNTNVYLIIFIYMYI